MTNAEGTFTGVGQCSAVLPSMGGFTLWVKGVDANNSVVLERSLNNGHTWSTVSTYTSDQTAVAVVESANAQHRLRCASIQALRNLRFKMSKETTTGAGGAPA